MLENDTNQIIDIVITWVDGTDPDWMELRAKYQSGNNASSIRNVDARNARFRPWDTLKYLFRGIEACAPWVRKIHLVTWGHLPSWLDVSNPRLSVVKHEDFIPKKYLPTFSSHAIEFNFHRIEGLSERFVYFNDDMLIIKPTVASDFFRGGLPCDAAVLSPHKVEYGDWFYTPLTNMAILNKHFRVHKVIGRHPLKWFNFKYGFDGLRTISMLPYPNFFGILNYHVPSSLTQEAFRELWAAEPVVMDETCSHRFRVSTDPNPWLIQEWQVASGRFAPRSVFFGDCFHIHNVQQADCAAQFIRARKRPLVCVNDVVDESVDFNDCRTIVEGALNDVFPRKCSFERA